MKRNTHLQKVFTTLVNLNKQIRLAIVASHFIFTKKQYNVIIKIKEIENGSINR